MRDSSERGEEEWVGGGIWSSIGGEGNIKLY